MPIKLKYTKLKLNLFKGELHNLIIIFIDFNKLITITNRTTRWKISKYIEEFNINQQVHLAFKENLTD